MAGSITTTGTKNGSIHTYSMDWLSDASGDVDTDAIGAGNIFKEPYLVKFVSEGEVSVALGEWGSIQSSVSGIVCSVVFTSKGSGSDVFYISSPHLIKSDGTFIDDFSMLSIESLEVRVGN